MVNHYEADARRKKASALLDAMQRASFRTGVTLTPELIRGLTAQQWAVIAAAAHCNPPSGLETVETVVRLLGWETAARGAEA